MSAEPTLFEQEVPLPELPSDAAALRDMLARVVRHVAFQPLPGLHRHNREVWKVEMAERGRLVDAVTDVLSGVDGGEEPAEALHRIVRLCHNRREAVGGQQIAEAGRRWSAEDAYFEGVQAALILVGELAAPACYRLSSFESPPPVTSMTPLCPLCACPLETNDDGGFRCVLPDCEYTWRES